MKYAVEKGFVALQSHFFSTFMHGVNRYPVPGFRFTTRNYAYNVAANTYSITSNIFSLMIPRASHGAHNAWLY